jgi:small subunit ribosomal protein S25e
MGGGKKKQTLSKKERAQSKTKAPKTSSAPKSTGEKHTSGITAPNTESVLGQMKKMSAITPYAVASRFDLRISVAKDLLQQLERKGTIEYVSGSKNLKIYRFAG